MWSSGPSEPEQIEIHSFAVTGAEGRVIAKLLIVIGEAGKKEEDYLSPICFCLFNSFGEASIFLFLPFRFD